MAKKEEKANAAQELVSKLTAEDVIIMSENISKSKTAGIFSPEKNVKWVELHRKLKAFGLEIKGALEDLQTQHGIVWKDDRLDLVKTGEKNWETYQAAYQLILRKPAEIELERFLTEDEVYRLKDKNDYTTEFVEFLINHLGVKEDGNQIN